MGWFLVILWVFDGWLEQFEFVVGFYCGCFWYMEIDWCVCVYVQCCVDLYVVVECQVVCSYVIGCECMYVVDVCVVQQVRC